jgi:uncharacterized protein YciI
VRRRLAPTPIDRQDQETPVPDPHHVVIHRPGPRWVAGRPPFEQDGARLHAAHYRQWLDDGRLLAGGPFLDADGGGMMIAASGIDVQALTAFAAADPAVAMGLLVFEVRPWFIAMHAWPAPAS